MYGSTLAFTDANGNASFSVSKQSVVAAGRLFTATATFGGDSPSETSEFSPAICSLIVTNTLESGLGSLREAIACANAVPNIDRDGDTVADPDPITFNIPGSGVQTISPAAALPTITDPVIIDGYTQPGASANTNGPGLRSNAVLRVELNGTGAGAMSNGLTITSGDSTVRGLAINRFAQRGIVLESGGGNRLEGNFIGTNAAGTVDLGNSNDGILIDGASGNTIGGTTAAARNIISGNDEDGIVIFGSGTTGNQVLGNFIGTDVNGTADLGNLLAGVNILDAPANTIGGTVSGAGNVVSGNELSGVAIIGSGATGNHVQGNFIGTDVSGTLARGNTLSGVFIEDAANNTIGGTTGAPRNVVSGNGDRGIAITGNEATGNVVQGNFIGTNAAGTAALGNSNDGILIDGASGNTIGGTTAAARNIISGNDEDGIVIFGSGATRNQVLGNFIGTDINGTADLGNLLAGVNILDAPGNTIGGTVSGAGNVIAFNLQSGVQISGSAAGPTGNAILGNSMRSNNGLGIDLGDDGVTVNDLGDADTGPNNLQNFLEIAEAIAATNVMRVSYLVTSTPGNSTYPLRVEFFKADANGQGQMFLGSDVYSAADFATGEKLVTFATAIVVAPDDKIVATATDSSPSGDFANTSEFSATKVTKASPWHNLAKPLDMDGDSHIVAGDALEIINYLNAFGPGPVPEGAADGPLFYDTNNDLSVTAADALEVINYINAFGADGEGEWRGNQLPQESANDASDPIVKSQDDLLALLALDVSLQPKRRK